MNTTTDNKGISPTHRIYCVIGEGKIARWIEIGSAWPNKDGKGFSISTHAASLTGRTVMREIRQISTNP